MNKESKILTEALSDILIKSTERFIMTILCEGEKDTIDLIDVVVSGHITSMFNNIRNLTADNE